MEAANNERQSRKRTRDDVVEGDADDINPAKKQDEQRRYEFYDGIGVFDFPWLKLKEGAIYNSEEDDEEEKFAPCSYLQDADDQNCNIIESQNYDLDDDDDDDSLWPLVVDDLEAVDCIWSCVVDHPLDLGFNKLRDK